MIFSAKIMLLSTCMIKTIIVNVPLVHPVLSKVFITLSQKSIKVYISTTDWFNSLNLPPLLFVVKPGVKITEVTGITPLNTSCYTVTYS